jgi:hypothetical protein
MDINTAEEYVELNGELSKSVIHLPQLSEGLSDIWNLMHVIKKLRGLSPGANYTVIATAACQLS